MLKFKMCGELRFGVGAVDQLAEVLSRHANPKVLVVTDAGLVKAGVVAEIERRLRAANTPFAVFDGVEPDPRFEIVDDCTAAITAAGANVLIGLGGGSSIDIAKVAAVIATNGGAPLDYVGIGNVPGAGLPVVAIPTTGGTGSETTPIAVLSDKREHLKKGIVSDFLYPDVALVDPALAAGLPPRITAYTGMDALTHCIEAYTNKFAQPFVDILAEEGIRLIARSIRGAFADGKDLQARTDMAMGSLLGGLCLGPVNTAAVHALAYPLGGSYDIAHGLANTVMLPHVMAFNAPAVAGKFGRVAELLGAPEATPEAAVEAVRSLARDLGMNLKLRDFGIPETAIPGMAEGAMKVTRLMKNNPRPMTAADCEAVFRAAF
jgi:alcohol dehydrogenase class IV